MRIKTIFNAVHPLKSFVYERAEFFGERSLVEVRIRPRRNGRPVCSGCGRRRPGYDTLPVRRFEFVPLWGLAVFLVSALRRVNCPRCGVKVERVPWASGKQRLTTTYAWFLARWAKRLSWSEVAEVFHTSYHHVFCAVELAVRWGRAHMSLEGITAIGVDEMQWGRGHHYVTVVYQLDAGSKRLLWVGEHRTVKTFLRFFRWLGKPRAAQIKFVCSDMWKPYLKVIAKKAGAALHILDRFHIMMHLSKAIDNIRAQEARELQKKGLEPVLKRSRWLFLRRTWNLSAGQVEKLAVILRYNLRTVRGYLLKEDFQSFWEYRSPYWAGRFLDQWCTRSMRSRLEPMKDVAKMLRRHRELILNWFRAKRVFSSGAVEGFNNKAKLTTRKAYGFSTFRALEIALYHTLGNLPEPEFTHEFF